MCKFKFKIGSNLTVWLSQWNCEWNYPLIESAICGITDEYVVTMGPKVASSSFSSPAVAEVLNSSAYRDWAGMEMCVLEWAQHQGTYRECQEL